MIDSFVASQFDEYITSTFEVYQFLIIQSESVINQRINPHK